MQLKFTQFAKAPVSRTSVCSRCGYRMFQTKRQFWVCGPGCDGAQQHEFQKKLDSTFTQGSSGKMELDQSYFS